MKKRGSVSISTFIVTIMAMLVIGTMLYVFLNDSGAFPGAKKNVDSFKEEYFTSNDDFNVILMNEGKISNKQINSEYDSFVSTIDKMLKSNETNCFSKFDGFSDLDASDIKISLIYDSSSSKTIIAPFEKKKKIIRKKAKLLEMVPCVIAGMGDVPENFFNRFIDKDKFNSPYYKQVNQIDVFYETDSDHWYTSCNNGNYVFVPEFGDSPVNDECDDFESQGWLFKPKKNTICLFPTNYKNNYDNDGIANEWFTTGETNSIPNRIKREELTKCFG